MRSDEKPLIKTWLSVSFRMLLYTRRLFPYIQIQNGWSSNNGPTFGKVSHSWNIFFYRYFNTVYPQEPTKLTERMVSIILTFHNCKVTSYCKPYAIHGFIKNFDLPLYYLTNCQEMEKQRSISIYHFIKSYNLLPKALRP